MTTRQNLSNPDVYLRMGYITSDPFLVFTGCSCFLLDIKSLSDFSSNNGGFKLHPCRPNLSLICPTDLIAAQVHIWPLLTCFSSSVLFFAPYHQSLQQPSTTPPPSLSHCLRDSWQRQGQLHTPLQLLVAPTGCFFNIRSVKAENMSW